LEIDRSVPTIRHEDRVHILYYILLNVVYKETCSILTLYSECSPV